MACPFNEYLEDTTFYQSTFRLTILVKNCERTSGCGGVGKGGGAVSVGRVSVGAAVVGAVGGIVWPRLLILQKQHIDNNNYRELQETVQKKKQTTNTSNNQVQTNKIEEHFYENL